MNEPSQPHNKQNGRWRANLWSILLGQLIMFIFWLAGYIFTQGIRQQQSTELWTKVGELQAQVKTMNENGTNYSHWQLTPRMEINSTRLGSLELKLNKYDVVVEKVDRLESEIKELKLRK